MCVRSAGGREPRAVPRGSGSRAFRGVAPLRPPKGSLSNLSTPTLVRWDGQSVLFRAEGAVRRSFVLVRSVSVSPMANPEFDPAHVRRAQEGDDDARNDLLRRLEPILRGYFIKRIGKEADVDDLVQNT